MRPTVYGREMIKNEKGELAGINLGYNYYLEHECGTEELLEGINDLAPKMKLRDKIKFSKIKRKYKHTPFNGHIINPQIPLIERKITIDNTRIKATYSKYKKFLLKDGQTYTQVVTATASYLLNRYKETKVTYAESDVLYMPDYQSNNFNTGWILNGSPSEPKYDEFAGAWDGSNGFMILFEDPKAADEFIAAIRRGVMAMVSEERSLFKDRGLSFIVLDKVYEN